MQKNNQRGAIDPLVIILVILILAVGAFVGWRILERNNYTDTTEQTSLQETNTPASETERNEVVNFSSNKLGISFDYPKSWGEAKEEEFDYTADGEVQDGYFNSITFSESSVAVIAASEDYFITKGPLPHSYSYITGFNEKNVIESDEYEEIDAKLVKVNGEEFAYVQADELFTEPKQTEYFYAHNLKNGRYSAFAITTYNESDLSNVEALLETLTID